MKKLSLIAGMLVGCSLFAYQPTTFYTQPAKNTKAPTAASSASKQQNKKPCIIENEVPNKPCILKIEATGVGVPPCNGACSVAQARVMARRAAIVDAYKSLAEKMYGIKVNGRDTVKNMILQNSNLRAYVNGLIRGAIIEEEDYKNGVYSVVLSVKLDPNEWNKYLKNAANSYSY